MTIGEYAEENNVTIKEIQDIVGGYKSTFISQVKIDKLDEAFKGNENTEEDIIIEEVVEEVVETTEEFDRTVKADWITDLQWLQFNSNCYDKPSILAQKGD